MSHSLQFLVFTMAGWLTRQQQDLIDYLREENRILREQLGNRVCVSQMRSAVVLQSEARCSDVRPCVEWPGSSHPTRFCGGTGG